MACSHHHNHQSTACCCSRRCITPPPPPPPPPAIDPILVQSIVSQLLQNPQTAHIHSAPNPAFSAAAFATNRFDLHPYFWQQQPQNHPKQKQEQQPHPSRQPFEDQFHDQHSVLFGLLQRIDALESSINQFSAPSSLTTAFSLRDVAARTIQIHFRVHLARRSRALRELKKLASIKSALNVLKSSISRQKRLDFISLSHEALQLIRRLDAIESGDQMVRDSKSSIRREISQFLGLVDEICAKRNQVSLKTVKHIKMARNDGKSRVSCTRRESSGAYHRVKASKPRNSDSDEKRLIENLRERVERIQHISNVFGEEEDSADSDDGVDVRGSKNYTDRCRMEHITGKDRPQSHAEKRVWSQEDGNATRFYDIHEDGELPMRSISGNMDRREESVDKQHEEDGEVENDSEENDVESAEGSKGEDEAQNPSLESSSLSSEAEEVPRKCLTNESNKKVNLSHVCRDAKLIHSAPPHAKMEGRADLVKKQKGVKMVG